VITEILRNIFRVNLGIKKTEKVLVFTDRTSPVELRDNADLEQRSRLKCIALLTAETGKSYARHVIFHEYRSTGSHGAEPPADLWRIAFGEKAVAALAKNGLLKRIIQKRSSDPDSERAEEILIRYRRNAVHAVIALSHYSTSHTRFRDLLTRVCKSRYASMPLFEISMLEGPMNVDWRQLARMTKEIAQKVNRADSIHISTPNGTRIVFSTKGRRAAADTGILNRAGAFGNLPAGEAYLAPLEGTAQGRLVLEWAPTRAQRERQYRRARHRYEQQGQAAGQHP
jgi:leucyl aminopeptidase (aminopeptidase T)